MSRLVSPILLVELDKVNQLQHKLEQELKAERAARQRELEEVSRLKQAYRQLNSKVSYAVSQYSL